MTDQPAQSAPSATEFRKQRFTNGIIDLSETTIDEFAEAYAALRIAQLEGDYEEARMLAIARWKQLKEAWNKQTELERERDKWMTLFYESEEYNCSCNIVDTTKPIGDLMNYVCDWHEQHPHIAVAREEVLTLAAGAETAESALSEARERTIRECAEEAATANHGLTAARKILNLLNSENKIETSSASAKGE